MLFSIWTQQLVASTGSGRWPLLRDAMLVWGEVSRAGLWVSQAVSSPRAAPRATVEHMSALDHLQLLAGGVRRGGARQEGDGVLQHAQQRARDRALPARAGGPHALLPRRALSPH